MLPNRDRRTRHLRLLPEMLRKPSAEVLDRAFEVVLCEGIGRVLHRVGRDYARVVALGMSRLERALERDGDGQVTDTLAPGPAHDPDEPDGRLAVAVFAELDHRPREPR